MSAQLDDRGAGRVEFVKVANVDAGDCGAGFGQGLFGNWHGSTANWDLNQQQRDLQPKPPSQWGSILGGLAGTIGGAIAGRPGWGGSGRAQYVPDWSGAA